MISRFTGGYNFLSNFYPSPLQFEGLDYPTVGHAYQATKAEVLRRAVQTSGSAGVVKRVGRGLALRADWEEVKLPVMEALLRKKFRDPILAAALRDTGEEELREGNYWHDNFWGECSCAGCADRPHLNHLGRLLMQVRGELHG